MLKPQENARLLLAETPAPSPKAFLRYSCKLFAGKAGAAGVCVCVFQTEKQEKDWLRGAEPARQHLMLQWAREPKRCSEGSPIAISFG